MDKRDAPAGQYIVLEYPERLWEFEQGWRFSDEIRFTSNQNFNKKFGKDLRLRIEFIKQKYKVMIYDNKSKDRTVKTLYSCQTEKEAREKLFDYVEELKQKYLLKEILK